MNKVIAEIDISTPAGRKIVRELERHKKLVKITYPVTFENKRLPDEAFFMSDVFAELEEKIKNIMI